MIVGIVNYGVGNLASIKNILNRIGVDAVDCSDKASVDSANKLILPGVGSFDACSEKLKQARLRDVITSRVLENKIPILGICVGMQLMLESSEEGNLPGLGWIKGSNLKFRQEQLQAGLKIPHMGWTEVSATRSTRLFQDMPENPRFYFVHSYHPQPANPDDVMLTATYGYRFTAGVERENIVGVQFHPEKSHSYGMKLLENFVKNY